MAPILCRMPKWLSELSRLSTRVSKNRNSGLPNSPTTTRKMRSLGFMLPSTSSQPKSALQLEAVLKLALATTVDSKVVSLTPVLRKKADRVKEFECPLRKESLTSSRLMASLILIAVPVAGGQRETRSILPRITCIVNVLRSMNHLPLLQPPLLLLHQQWADSLPTPPAIMDDICSSKADSLLGNWLRTKTQRMVM